MAGGGQVTPIRADARSLPLANDSVDLICTSPPYFALRSYTDGGEHYAGQIGSESTPQEYIASLVECTREWMRVLKPDGSIWVNLGDKYSGAGRGNHDSEALNNTPEFRAARLRTLDSRQHVGKGIIPAKSLMLLPERYRIACVDELGLIARAVVVWSKPNGLPESVTDRVRRSHEDWVHLVKQPRYYAAVDTIRQPQMHGLDRVGTKNRQGTKWQDRADGGAPRFNSSERVLHPLGALPGSVWEIATEPLVVPEHLGVDHFAAFPTEWPRRIILGWSSSGICTVCGEGRRPITIASYERLQRMNGADKWTATNQDGRGQAVSPFGRARKNIAVTGEACACPPCAKCDNTRQSWLVAGKPCHACPPTRPAVVLDPFGGTGTTALVADVLGRVGISIDMSADYCRLARWRVSDPGQRAKAMRVPKPEIVPEGQLSLFDSGSGGEL